MKVRLQRLSEKVSPCCGASRETWDQVVGDNDIVDINDDDDLFVVDDDDDDAGVGGGDDIVEVGGDDNIAGVGGDGDIAGVGSHLVEVLEIILHSMERHAAVLHLLLVTHSLSNMVLFALKCN